jgi:hypothetical protein
MGILLVAGCCAVFRKPLEKQIRTINLSVVRIKPLLIDVTVRLAGQYNPGRRDLSYMSVWRLVDVANSVVFPRCPTDAVDSLPEKAWLKVGGRV